MLTNAPHIDTIPAKHHSSVALIRASLLKCSGLLAVVFLLASCLLIYVARDLNRTEEAEGVFYTEKAVDSLEKSARLTLKDYAFWGDAYKHLHIKVDTDWAFVNQNAGSTLYTDFGFQGVFVIDGAGSTVYSVIEGELRDVTIEAWLGQHVDELSNQAREAAKNVTPVTAFLNVGGIPAVVAAAALTPGTDPTIEVDEGPASVMVFVTVLDGPKLEAIGADYGIEGLRMLSANDAPSSSLLLLGDKGSAGILHWNPETPGQRLLGLMLPLLGAAGLLVLGMTLVVLRRTTLAARALDHSYESLQLSEATLTASEERFRDVAEASSDWIWEIDSDGNFTYLSERFEEVTGLSREDWIGAGIDSLLHTELSSISQWLAMPKRRPNGSVQCSYTDLKGQQRVTRLSAREMASNGFRGTATDVTDEVEARRRIEYLSQHDSLTGLPNRTRLQEFLDGKLKAAPTHEHPLVMLSVDLDRFKPVNDLLGHAAGDHVLTEISHRLGECVRSGDLVARIGGDEFVLILTDISSQEQVEALCRRLINSVEKPVAINDQEVFVSASIGIAMAPNDASQATELLRYADIALYEAKAGGRNTWRFYAGGMNAKIIERRRLESDLRYAIKHGELRLHFQPRLRISDGQMVGAEALVRWQHPERGMIPPDVFIPIAEETGLIMPLSDWVLHTACCTANRWTNDVFVSVNLSPTEFQRGNLVARVQKALADTRFNPTRLELELTESVMLDDAASALDVMIGLKALGVRLSLDDFGTGYSSLSYLRSFPFDGLKIDRSFVNTLGENENDKSIIQAIVGLGRALSLTITAEGIETAEQWAMLEEVRCDEGQGYLISRPLDSDAFSTWVDSQD
jgi:diguanylate cyclase (GGDEF)-like protein/PAS domain S-box-containing protein